MGICKKHKVKMPIQTCPMCLMAIVNENELLEESLKIETEVNAKLQAENERLREAIHSVPTNEYGEAQRDGCDSCGAWDCFIEALGEWQTKALQEKPK